jgi:hypothetical protein
LRPIDDDDPSDGTTLTYALVQNIATMLAMTAGIVS